MRVPGQISFARLLPVAAAGVVVAVYALSGEPRPGPRIRFESTTHDFGTVASDGVIQFDWEYHNDGDAPLEILGTKPQCGCTVTLPSERPIPPGATGVLQVRFDPSGMNGSIRKSLAVMSNDPEASRMLLTIVARVRAVPVRREPGEHPRTTGQSMLVGDCVGCHAAPAADKVGEPLYRAVCAMCHGPMAGGDLAPSIRTPDYLDSRSDEELATAIAFGTANPKMPGFVDLMGGPLTRDQVDSLVRLLREWGPLSARDAPAAATEQP